MICTGTWRLRTTEGPDQAIAFGRLLAPKVCANPTKHCKAEIFVDAAFKVGARVLVLDIRDQEISPGTILDVRYIERHVDFNVHFPERFTFQYRVRYDWYYEKKYERAWTDELRILSAGNF